MKLGQRMIRLMDGMRGIVAQNGPELRILYRVHGEELLAPKSEKWVPEEPEPRRMRPEEEWLIACHADRALRAYERNEPLKTWQEVDPDAEPYDKGLMLAVMDYLARRGKERKSPLSS